MSDTPDSLAGALAGTVQDADGSVLPGTTVTATGGVTEVRITEADGRYRMVGLPAGDYRVTAELEGFAPGQAEAEVRPREKTMANFTLRPASAGE